MEYRKCEFCGHLNNPSFLECEKEDCGADISYLAPVFIDEKKMADQTSEFESVAVPILAKTIRMSLLSLVSEKDQFVIDIPGEGGMIGRDGSLSSHYFSENLFVSNQHAKIIPAFDGYMVIDQSTNGTKINGVKLEKGAPSQIKPGDEITFANVTFKVK